VVGLHDLVLKALIPPRHMIIGNSEAEDASLPEN